MRQYSPVWGCSEKIISSLCRIMVHGYGSGHYGQTLKWKHCLFVNPFRHAMNAASCVGNTVRWRHFQTEITTANGAYPVWMQTRCQSLDKFLIPHTKGWFSIAETVNFSVCIPGEHLYQPDTIFLNIAFYPSAPHPFLCLPPLVLALGDIRKGRPCDLGDVNSDEMCSSIRKPAAREQ